MQNQFLTNYTEFTFLDKIKDNLRRCNSFSFSVSFIKKAGLVLLFKDIEAAVERGCTGRIITSTYQNFTDIESLKSFFALMNRCPNFKCHLDYECFHDSAYSTLGYHSKGYLFMFDDHTEVIIGSPNITRYALLKNIEWDVVVRDDAVYQQAMAEFEDKWNATHLLNGEIINLYANKLNFAIERWDMDYDLATANVKPNFMQRKALKELNRYRAVGTNRALVVAAAGSGKTYLAAFDALNFNPKRLLYIVHEGSILKKSLETFQDVFGSNVSYGIYSGTSKESDADFVFATNITMCKTLELFARDEFDYQRITIRAQKTRWGSCSAKGNLNFNCLLMLCPETVRDYVVVHELCHRKELNHSVRFWKEVERILPTFTESRKWLKQNGSALIRRLP